MKKRSNLKNIIGKKNLLLTIVALFLVMILTVGVSYSWIEQISNVEMIFGDTDASPMHISTERLNQTAQAMITPPANECIDLSHYFYESGDMHLSPCYSDSKTFYFPKQANNGNQNVPTYRLGTKDDANVNYISVSFKLTNTENYEQAYWFDKSSTFFASKDNANPNNLDKLIRMSMTVDGATSVFSASDTPEYKTVSGINGSISTVSCQSFNAYKYDATANDQYSSAQASNYNQNHNETRGNNGNVLFVLPPKKSSIVTVKVWLEYDGTARASRLSDINLKLVSSFAQTRNIFVVDNSLYGDTWITGDSATLWLALDDVDSYTYSDDDNPYNDTYWPLTDKDTVGSKKRYAATIPAYLNGQNAYILRCSNSGFGEGDTSKPEQKFKTIDTTDYWAWNWWKTQLPDTYDDRTFTEYTPEFGTWSSKVHHFYFVDSWSWQDSAHAYMWDNKTATADTKVIENGTWPGARMYWASQMSLTNGSTSISNGLIGNTHRIYAVFYDTDFTNVIFNNGSNQQTGDLWIPSDIDDHDYFYDLRSGRWLTDIRDICYHESNANYTWPGSSNDEEFYYSDNYDHSDSSKAIQYATKYLTAGSFYNFQIHNYDKYLKPTSENWTYKFEYSPNTEVSVEDSNNTSYYLCIKENNSDGCFRTGMYTIKYNTNTNKVSIVYPGKVDPGTTTVGSDSTSGGSSSGNAITNGMSGAGVYLYGALDGTGTPDQLFKLTEVSSGTFEGELTLAQSSDNYLYHLIVREAISNSSWTNYQADSNAYIVLNSNTNTENYYLSSSNSNPLYLRVGASLTYKFTYTTSNHQIKITKASTGSAS